MANEKAAQKQVLYIVSQLNKAYGNDFEKWARETIDFTGLTYPSLTEQQTEISRALVKDKFVCVSAGGGIGKSALAALLTIWYLSCHHYAIVATTAPTAKQLEDVLWSQISQWLKRYKYQDLFTLLSQKLYIKHFKEWYAVARTVSKDARQLNDTLAGLHSSSGNIFIIVDEASGVPDPVFTALDGALTSKGASVLLISNPVSTSGYYYDTISDPDGKGKHYTVLYFDARNSPLVDKNFEELIAARYGRDSAMFQAKVMGLPIGLDDAFLITPQAYDKLIRDNTMIMDGRVILGVDVGGSGSDPTIICHRQGNSIIAWNEFTINDTAFLVEEINRIVATKYAGKNVCVVVDALGIGAGVYSYLTRLRKFPVVGHVGSEKAFQENMFDIKRTEAYYKLKQTILDLHFPVKPPDRLKKELVNIEFDYSGLKIQMKLTKKQLVARLGFSTDYADALTLTTIVDNFSMLSSINFVSPGARSKLSSLMLQRNKEQRYGKFARFIK